MRLLQSRMLLLLLLLLSSRLFGFGYSFAHAWNLRLPTTTPSWSSQRRIAVTPTTATTTTFQRISTVFFSRQSQHGQQQQQQQQQEQQQKQQRRHHHDAWQLLVLSSSNSNNNNNNNDDKDDDTVSDWRYYSGDSTKNSPADDWLATLTSKQDGSFWTSFEPSAEDEDGGLSSKTKAVASKDDDNDDDSDDESEAWLETLASLSAEEIQFNQKEGERADMLRKMEEYQFSPQVIAATLGVATDSSLEDDDATLVQFRNSAYDEWDRLDDLEQVESHARVPMDPDSNYTVPIRSQMVYVDEHTCIGCTNCASVAQSTFFMHSEHGRARVFQQWGDDDDTIQIAIETCPVDCIHYVPYDELVHLERERRNQNINFKARLVSQSDNVLNTGAGFTGPQRISGNLRARCNNCPTRGCRDCPMYGVGKNPEFERREQRRLAQQQRRQLERERESLQQKADL